MGTNIITPGESERTNYAGHLFDWKLLGSATGGTLALAEVEGWQGGEPPFHVHEREDEFFYILEGEMTFKIGDELKRATPGTMVWAPRAVPHGFMFDTERVRLLIGFSPAGQDTLFRAFSTPATGTLPRAPQPAEMPDFEAIEAADKRAGVIYLGPPLRDMLADTNAA
jgi:quercetin dioxygenase-like cupin family protein